MYNHNIKDSHKRDLFKKYEYKRRELKAIFNNTELPEGIRSEAFYELESLPKNSSLTRVRNRCIYTGRGRSVSRTLKISRLTFRELSSNGYIPGITKSSW